MGAYSDRVLADGASYYWRLGEAAGTTAVDEKGLANGTISGGVTLNQPGALSDGNRAMTFNGATGKVQTVASVTIPAIFSLEAWVKFSAVADMTVLSSRGLSTGEVVVFYASTGNGHMNLFATGTIPTGAPVRDGQWHHVVAIADGGTAYRMFLDGLQSNSVTSTARAGSSTGPIAIGTDQTFGQWWNGAVDEVAIYPRALTAAEIAAHYTLARQSVSWPGVPWWVQIQGDDALDNFNVWEPVTPSNTVDLPRGVSGGLWVGSGGDVAAVMQNNVMPVVFAAVPTGAWLPIAAKRINATGTTATGLVALYET